MSPFFLYPHSAPALPVLTRAVKQFALKAKCKKSVVFPWICKISMDILQKKAEINYNTSTTSANVVNF